MKSKINKNAWLRTFCAIFVPIAGIAFAVLHTGSVQADDLPVEYVSGTLEDDQTWTSGKVYMISGGVTIPDGVTLTITEGAIVKISFSTSGINVQNGGTLNATGTSTNPVVFTSYKDDSFGGDSNGDGASSAGDFDYSLAVNSSSGGTVLLSHTDVRSGYQAIQTDCVAGSGNGTVSLTDSELKARVDIYHCLAGQFTLQHNHFAVPAGGGRPIEVRSSDASIVQLTGTNKNTFTGSGLATVVYLDGASVPTGSTWEVDNSSGLGALYIGNSLYTYGTLDLSEDVVVKITSGGTGINVQNGGTLNATGTSTNPVVFTSYKDDSFGGDSNGDGASSAGDFDYSLAVNSSSGGTVLLSHTDVRSGYQAIQTDCVAGSGNGTVSLTDSELKARVDIYHCLAGQFTLQHNHFAVPAGGGRPIEVRSSDASIVQLTGTNKNTFTGSGLATVVYLDGASVPTGSTWEVDNSSGLGALYIGNSLYTYGTLDLSEDVVVKITSGGTGINVQNGGTLNATGTSTNPVVFTSYKDDSFGGDSNGDGASSAGDFDYSLAVNSSSGGTVLLSHTDVRSGYQAIQTDCVAGSGNGTVSLTDSELKARVDIYHCLAGQFTLQHNHFAVPAGGGRPIEVRSSDASIVQLTGTNKNTFTGSGLATVVYLDGASVPTGSTWEVDNSSGLGALYIGNSLYTYGTLDLSEDVVVKITSGGTGINVQNGGTLNATGTSTNPVVFTSYKDDSFGGDSNGDGASSGAVGDYSTAIQQNTGASLTTSGVTAKYANVAFSLNDEATADEVDIWSVGTGYSIVGQSDIVITDTTISEATTGLTVDGSAYVTFRGTFDAINGKAIVACSWDESCSVDATYTEWGTSNGPFLSSGTLACGNVVTIPWKHGSTTHDGSTLFIPNCDNSDTPDQVLETSIGNFQQAMSSKQIDCGNGFEDACEAMETALACLGGAVNLAGSTSPIPLPQIDSSGDIDSWGSTVKGAATDYIRDEAIEAVLPSTAERIFEKLTPLIGLFTAMSNAYNQCAP